MKAILKVCVPALAAAFLFATGTAIAHTPLEVAQDRAQLKSDEAALQGQI